MYYLTRYAGALWSWLFPFTCTCGSCRLKSFSDLTGDFDWSAQRIPQGIPLQLYFNPKIFQPFPVFKVLKPFFVFALVYLGI